MEGLVRTLDIHINLSQKDMTSLKEKGTVLFWQKDMETSIAEHSNFFIPVRVLVGSQKNMLKHT